MQVPFQILYGVLQGSVTVKIPTDQLDEFTGVNDAPFRLHIDPEGDGQGIHIIENITSENWESNQTDGLTVYTRTQPLEFSATFELLPLSGLNSQDDFYFPSTGFIHLANTLYTVNVQEGWDYTAPTLAPAGIERVFTTSDGVTPLQTNGGKDSAYTISFSEPVDLDQGIVHSFGLANNLLTSNSNPSQYFGNKNNLFGGVPSGSTFVLTPMASTSTLPAPALLGYSDLWHVKVTTPMPYDYVNLTLTPQLQIVEYDSNNPQPPVTDDEQYLNRYTANGLDFIFEPNYNSFTEYWHKVTFDGDLYEGRDFGNPVFAVDYIKDNSIIESHQTIAVARSTSEKNILWLGFVNPPPVGESFDEVRLHPKQGDPSPIGGMIVDESGNFMLQTSDLLNTEILLGPFRSWTSDYYAASPNAEPFESLLTDANLGTFFSQGTFAGFEVLDMSGLTNKELLVDAEYRNLWVYDNSGDPRVFKINYYDKYILNDRPSILVDGEEVYNSFNIFYGTTDSEYVVVGDGGGNVLEAGNQGSNSSVPETDIIDFSEVTNSGVTVNLGDSARATVHVNYHDYRENDRIIGFEGVVGSKGHDDISGSNVGNYLSGGDGNDTLRGYSWTAPTSSDQLYNIEDYVQSYILDLPEYLKNPENEAVNRADALDALKAESSDLLVGGTGFDTLYGGAGRDILVDLDAAVMWGSDKWGEDGDGMQVAGNLRNNNDSTIAEYDSFVVRGTTTEVAKIENFHLSKNGTGLAGRSFDAHDSIVFSLDSFKLIDDVYTIDPLLGEKLFGRFLNDNLDLEAGMGPDLYHYVYDNLTFTKTEIGTADDMDMKLTASFSDKVLDPESIYSAVIGEVVIGDLETKLGNKVNGRFQNEVEVVELDWLAYELHNNPGSFNPKLDFDTISKDSFWSYEDMNIAIGLELVQAGTVRKANAYDIMASNLSDMSLGERIFNPGDDDDTILGSAGKDIYEFIVQDFNETQQDAENNFDAGDDTIFDIGGNDDTLAFSEATISDLRFSAVQVGRESGLKSLRVEYGQTLNPSNNNEMIINRGDITWQGHFREGGRQAAEFVTVSDGTVSGVETYAMAKTVYEYDRKGYVKAGSEKIVANDMFNAIMVGRNDGADEFVFQKEVAVGSLTPLTLQKASIAGYNNGDNIDISAYVGAYGIATHVLAADGKSAVVTFDQTPENTSSVNFRLELAFQEAVMGELQFLYGTPPPL